MEDFTPEKLYHPEDEYESLEEAQTQQLHPQPMPQPMPQPTQQPVQQPYPAEPYYQQPYAGGQQTNPVYPPQNSYPQQMQRAVQPPVQTPQQPVQPQQPVYPYQGNYPQYQQPVQQPYPQQAPVQQPYQQPVQNQPTVPNPYTQPYPQQPIQPKPATSTGTKVFIIILCALLLAMVIGFIVYISTSAKNNTNNNLPSDNGFSFGDGNEGIEINPFDSNNAIQPESYTEIEDEITLKADNGDTQKRDDDNQNSIGKPDEKAKNITLNPLPKDQDDEKYTTQSAYEAVSDSVVTVVCYEGEITDNDKDIVAQGTGTIISPDGYLVTNAHVIGNSRIYAVNIVLNNGDEYQAKIIGYDTWTDLAVLKIDAEKLQAVTFGDSELIKIGQDVIAIGSPGGKKFQNSLTKGIVSAVDRELTINRYVHYIQSDAAISPGNSGGPLCNIYGQVIGITTAKTIATYYEGMTFSIPSTTVEEIVGDLMHYGYVTGRTRIGISGTETASGYDSFYEVPAGVAIETIDESGSLAGTKVKEGDIITELDGQEIASFQDIYDVLADHKEGDKISIKVQRPAN